LSRIPTPREAIRLLKKAGCSPNVVQHCKNVSKLAVEMAKKLQAKGIEVDIRLVEIGGLLHDIGRSKTHGIDHAYIGSRIARSLNLPESFVRIVERHIGAGIPSEESVKLGLPNKDFIPETLEEKVVSYSDKLIDGDRKMGFEEAFRRFSKDLGKSHPAVRRFKKLHDELARIIGDSV